MSKDPTQLAQLNGNPTHVSTLVRKIDTILQISGSFRVHPFPDGCEAASLRPINESGKCDSTIDGDRVIVQITFSFAAEAKPVARAENAAVGSSDIPPVRVFEAEGTFQAEYLLDEFQEIKDIDRVAFAEINGRVNLVPYWREFVHNALARANLPAYEIPVFNVYRLSRAPHTQQADPPKR